MALTQVGVIKRAANKLGISVEEYIRHVELGLKNCFRCKQWLNPDLFHTDKTKFDGKNSSCIQCRKAYHSSTYKPISEELRRIPGPVPSPSRDGDKGQARLRVVQAIKRGRMPPANDLPCVDCGHIGSGRPHYYDHYKGYAAIHHLDVECVCSTCHGAREKQRRNA